MTENDTGLDPVEQWFAVNLKAARREAGLSQEALAARMCEVGFGSWKQQTVTKLENGTRRVLLAEARALARILGMTEARLTGPPQGVEDVIALREAMSRLWQYRSDEQFAAARHAEARSELRDLIAKAEADGKAEALADVITSAQAMLKEG